MQKSCTDRIWFWFPAGIDHKQTDYFMVRTHDEDYKSSIWSATFPQRFLDAISGRYELVIKELLTINKLIYRASTQ
jgi:hypothetical protein